MNPRALALLFCLAIIDRDPTVRRMAGILLALGTLEVLATLDRGDA